MLPSNTLLATFLTPGVAWALGVLGLCIWMLFHPRANEPVKILLLFVGFVILGPICDAVMNIESRNTPMKFDYFLYVVDVNLGVSAFSVARLFTDWQGYILYAIYQSLTVFMILWYGLNLTRRDGRPNKLLIAYVVGYLIGPCLYMLLPARGPRHAFGSAFPMGNPDVSPALVQLSGWPNAIPSLHVSTALLFVLFAGKNRVLRVVAWIYLAGTVAATLAFEHYLIDLIVAVPFAYFVTRIAEGKTAQALGNLAVVLAWLLTIRFRTPALVMYPAVLRVLAFATIAFAGFSMPGGRKSATNDLLQPLSTELPCAASAAHSRE